jgi:hypothetical protein
MAQKCYPILANSIASRPFRDDGSPHVLEITHGANGRATRGRGMAGSGLSACLDLFYNQRRPGTTERSTTSSARRP